jgi:hypothetical protein
MVECDSPVHTQCTATHILSGATIQKTQLTESILESVKAGISRAKSCAVTIRSEAYRLAQPKPRARRPYRLIWQGAMRRREEIGCRFV